jgi:hypothetical protein
LVRFQNDASKTPPGLRDMNDRRSQPTIPTQTHIVGPGAGDAALGMVYAAFAMALFGGFAGQHLPQGVFGRYAIVVGGAALLLLAALWLDRRERQREIPPADGDALGSSD